MMIRLILSQGIKRSSVVTLALLIALSLSGLLFCYRDWTRNQAVFRRVATRTDTIQKGLAEAPIAGAQNGKYARSDARLRQLIAQRPLVFELNRGQAEGQVRFVSRGSGYSLSLTTTAALFALRKGVLRIALQGANLNARIEGLDELPGRSNYFLGSKSESWRTDVPTYRRVQYQGIYPGINLTYYGSQRELEYDFEITPGADLGMVRFNCAAAGGVHIDNSGDLVVKTRGGEIRQRKPVVYQEVNGTRQMIDGHYVIKKKNEVGFEVAQYDTSRTLVIDPTLVYSTYLGSSGDDSGSSIDVDASGNIYVTGVTNSATFPTRNAYQSANAGTSDVFVTKLDPSGANLVYSTYIGASGIDRADGIAVDINGSAYVVGRADSVSTNFPTTSGALAPSYRGGDFDGFLFKLGAQGNTLAYSTYIGGEDNDSAIGVAVDLSGDAYVTGGTRSTGFPTTAGAYQSGRAGDTDAYLMELNPAGSGLLYATFLGGSGTDRGSSVKVDNSGNAYVVGYTSASDFPTVNPFQPTASGSFDAFVAKINTKASGSESLVYCSYLGGSADDRGYGLALDSGSSVYVAGQTSSNDFPVLGAAQGVKGGQFDAFVAKIGPAGNKVYATYLGGSGDDRATAIAVNSLGNCYATGFTSSINFPVVTPLQSSSGGGVDAFVTKVNSSGNAFVYSTYLGGSGNEDFTSTVTFSGSIALDSGGNAYVTGYTASTNFPTASPFQATNGGGTSDAFLTKISDATPPSDFAITAAPPSQTVSPGGSTTYNLTVTPAGGFIGNVALNVSGLSGDSAFSFTPSVINVTDTSAKPSNLAITTTAATPPGTYVLTITGASGNLQHTVPATLVVSGTPSVNLSLSKTASPNPAIVASNLTYRLFVTNGGPSPASGVTATDTLPVGVNFVSVTSTQGSCTGTSTVSCNLGSLASGGNVTVSITVVPQATGQLSNTASATANETDSDPGNNSATISTNVTTQSTGPSMLDPTLAVKTVITGLSQPTSMAFLGSDDFLLLEKNTGKVQRVLSGAVQSAVLDLPVNSASERGLLGIALHPHFKINGFVYLYWTESSTGADSANLQNVALLGNRIDRYFWNGATLTFDSNVIKLHAYQADANQPLRGNHNGGVLRFGPDGKLYLIMGDNGRRGFLQNVTNGQVPDDQFGGPEPDNAHLTGVILRLNDDGSTPADNPFFNVSTNLTGEAAMNIKKLYAYGVRNSFGMAFDPLSGNLWEEENGDDAFDEINRATAGANNGWVQTMGPVGRVDQYKQIELTYGAGTLQQLRWPPSLIADTSQAALAALYMLPGAHYNDPEFSWKYAVAPSPIGFVQGRGLGAQFEGDLFVGAARTFLAGGYLFRFKLTGDRQHFSFTDSRLADLVADDLDKFDLTESESLLIGKDFGITTDIETGPNGDLFVVSNTSGAVYEISATPPALFVASLNGSEEVPATNSTAAGTATLLLNSDELGARVSLNFSGLSSPQRAAHIHGPAAPGVSAPVLFPLPLGQVSDFQIPLTLSQVLDLKSGQFYISVHSNTFSGGEIRGQFGTSPAASSVQFNTANFSTPESGGGAMITVTRLGSTSGPATVDYATSDGTGTSRTDYTTSYGTLNFAAGENFKTFIVPIVDDLYVEGGEVINLTLSNPTGGAFLGSPNKAMLAVTDNDITTATTNPLDDASFFVTQHYFDFLSREPDLGGLAYWTNEITKCGSITSCVNDRKISVSAAFFIEAEFQQTGSFVYRLYKGALGRQPNYSEFAADRSKVVGGADLEVNKTVLTNDFVQRVEFKQIYPDAMTNDQFVNTLFDTAGLTPFATERQQEVDALSAGKTRAQVVRDVIEIQAFKDREYNPSFVLMQYFGYLGRDPDPGGYSFWLNVLNNQEPNNYRGMLCSFITSAEYQQRFSPIATHGNVECAGVH